MATTDWSTLEGAYEELFAADLTAATVDDWLRRWSGLTAQLYEDKVAAERAISENTADEEASERYDKIADEIEPKQQMADQKLRARLLALADSGNWQPAPDQVEMLKRFGAAEEVFSEANVPLLSELMKREMAYERLMGGLEIEWEGKSETLYQAHVHLESKDRDERERAWRKIMAAYAEKRSELNTTYAELLALRRQVAANAGLADYRAYKWKEYGRFDYTPADAMNFLDAIEHEVVPLAAKLREGRRTALGLGTLRPWDTEVDPHGDPLRPFTTVAELEAGVQRIFEAVDPALAAYFATMRSGWLDLESRPNKAGGGYCEWFPVSGMPYIFTNAAGVHDDVMTMLHEGGHAFHSLESARQPLFWNQNASIEFCEVASTAMELLAQPYFEAERGGFYTAGEARRVRAEELRKYVLFLPYMAVVDAFQHYVYTEVPEALPATALSETLDAKWAELWDRYMKGVDWSGLDEEKETGWHRKQHIFSDPFYYIEYGLAQVGALQVWRNAQRDQAAAMAAYRGALQLGHTRPLGELFRAAGARFAFDRQTLGELMAAIEAELAGLRA